MRGGTPIDGARNLTFRIYDDTTGGGTLQWSETQNGVQVGHGLFNVVLGKSTALNLAFDKSYWLEVEVGGEVMPRIRFTSVGYACRADTAYYAISGPWGGNNAWTFRVTDGADTTLTTGGGWGIARYGNVLHGNKDSTHVNLGVACTTGTSGENYRYCTVGGGSHNNASGDYATVGGGYGNTASEISATVGGGTFNSASDLYATVGGGVANTASALTTTVGGGNANTASGDRATVGGGIFNTASGICATVGGGTDNTASGKCATVGGGSLNTASGNYSFAAGRKAKADHLGTFVWADSSVNADFASTATNQFSIRAENGVRLASDAGGSKVINVGERYRDNGIVAWGKVSSGGSLSGDFGVSSVTNSSTGVYAITINATASDANTLIPIAQAEVEASGTIRIVSVNQTGTKTFEVYINDSGFNRVNNDFVFMVTAR